MKRTCTAVACNVSIGMGQTFCDRHWMLVPSALQMSIAGLNKRARAGEAEAVQHRWMYALLQARHAVAVSERRGAQPIAPAYKANAEREAALELRKAA